MPLNVSKRRLDNAPVAVYQVETRSGERTFKVPERRQVTAPTTVEVSERDVKACPRCDAPLADETCSACGFSVAGLVFRGHAAVFDRRSEDLGGFTEQVARGAFRRCLDRHPDCRALINHDPSLLLASTANNTLDLREDPLGLHFYFTAAPTSYARDLQILVARGDMSQSSFAFSVERDRWEEQEDGSVLRTVLEMKDLYDVSPVSYPAYRQTSVSTNSAEPEEERTNEAARRRASAADAGRRVALARARP